MGVVMNQVCRLMRHSFPAGEKSRAILAGREEYSAGPKTARGARIRKRQSSGHGFDAPLGPVLQIF